MRHGNTWGVQAPDQLRYQKLTHNKCIHDNKKIYTFIMTVFLTQR